MPLPVRLLFDGLEDCKQPIEFDRHWEEVIFEAGALPGVSAHERDARPPAVTLGEFPGELRTIRFQRVDLNKDKLGADLADKGLRIVYALAADAPVPGAFKDEAKDTPHRGVCIHHEDGAPDQFLLNG